jgi:hypothetical protein
MQAATNYIAHASGGRLPSPTWQPPRTAPGAPGAPGAPHPQGSGGQYTALPWQQQPPPSGGRQQGQGRPSGSVGGTRPICQICSKVGHVASCCFKRFQKDYLGAGNDGRNMER